MRAWKPYRYREQILPHRLFKTLHITEPNRTGASLSFSRTLWVMNVHAKNRGDVRTKEWVFLQPRDGENLFDPWASGRKGRERLQEIRTKKFMFTIRNAWITILIPLEYFDVILDGGTSALVIGF